MYTALPTQDEEGDEEGGVLGWGKTQYIAHIYQNRNGRVAIVKCRIRMDTNSSHKTGLKSTPHGASTLELGPVYYEQGQLLYLVPQTNGKALLFVVIESARSSNAGYVLILILLCDRQIPGNHRRWHAR